MRQTLELGPLEGDGGAASWATATEARSEDGTVVTLKLAGLLVVRESELILKSHTHTR